MYTSNTLGQGAADARGREAQRVGGERPHGHSQLGYGLGDNRLLTSGDGSDSAQGAAKHVPRAGADLEEHARVAQGHAAIAPPKVPAPKREAELLAPAPGFALPRDEHSEHVFIIARMLTLNSDTFLLLNRYVFLFRTRRADLGEFKKR
jgi:hypothetical protein